MPEILEADNVSAYYDTEQRISFITYRNALNAEVTGQLYAWVGRLIAEIGPDATYAVIFDFRQVRAFQQGNLSASRKMSQEINTKEDHINHPVALIVTTPYQRQMVQAAVNLSPGESRKKIVYSMDEAMEFIRQWHEARKQKEQS